MNLKSEKWKKFFYHCTNGLLYSIQILYFFRVFFRKRWKMLHEWENVGKWFLCRFCRSRYRIFIYFHVVFVTHLFRSHSLLFSRKSFCVLDPSFFFKWFNSIQCIIAVLYSVICSIDLNAIQSVHKHTYIFQFVSVSVSVSLSLSLFPSMVFDEWEKASIFTWSFNHWDWLETLTTFTDYTYNFV